MFSSVLAETEKSNKIYSYEQNPNSQLEMEHHRTCYILCLPQLDATNNSWVQLESELTATAEEETITAVVVCVPPT